MGILGSSGAYNRRQRRLCQPPFVSPRSLQTFVATVGRHVGELTHTWQSLAAGGGEPASKRGEGAGGASALRADLADHMQRLTLDLVGEVAFSHDFRQVAQLRDPQQRRHEGQSGPLAAADDADNGGHELLEDINRSQAIMGALFVTPMPLLRALRAAGAPFMISLETAFASMRAHMDAVVAARRAAAAAEAGAGGCPRRVDLLDALLEAKDRDSGLGLNDAEIWEDIHDASRPALPPRRPPGSPRLPGSLLYFDPAAVGPPDAVRL